MLHHEALAGAHVLLGHADHQLDAIKLVDLRGARVVIHRHDVALGMLTAQLLDHRLAHHMVGQARKRLRTDDIGRTVVNKVEHLGRKQPTLAHVVAQRQHLRSLIRHSTDGLGSLKAIGLLQQILHRLAHPVHHANERIHARARNGRASQLVLLQIGIAHGVQEEVEQARHHGLAALVLDNLNHVVVCRGMELDENLAHHAYARLGPLALKRHGIERLDSLARQAREVAAIELRR